MSDTFPIIVKLFIASLTLSSCANSHHDGSERSETGALQVWTAPETALIPVGTFKAGSNYAESVACTENVPPHDATLGDESAEQYCERVGPHVWFLDEQPIRDVSFDTAIEFSITEVTVEQFASFVDETGYITTAEETGATLGFDKDQSTVETFSRVEGYTWKQPWPGAGSIEYLSNYPAVHVSRKDALAYCNWLSTKTGDRWRLPTADEWEYAALAGQINYPQSGTYAWGANLPDQEAYGNVSDISFANEFPDWKYPVLSSHNDGFALTSPVATFKANKFGLFDMTGNVR